MTRAFRSVEGGFGGPLPRSTVRRPEPRREAAAQASAPIPVRVAIRACAACGDVEPMSPANVLCVGCREDGVPQPRLQP